MAGTFDDIIRSVLGSQQQPDEPIATMKSPWLQVPPDSMTDVAPREEKVRQHVQPMSVYDDLMRTYNILVGNPLDTPRMARAKTQRNAVQGDADVMMDAITRRQQLGRNEE